MKRFDIGGSVANPADTSGIFNLFDGTDNPSYYDQDTAAQPTVKCWLDSLQVGADTACKIEVGLTNSGKSSFTPYAAIYLAAGTTGRVDFPQDRPQLLFDAATVKLLAVRISVGTTATVHASGVVNFSTR